MDITARVLTEHPFFQGLDARYLDVLAGLASAQQFEDGQYILREGQSADEFYLIQSGEVSLEIFVAERGVIKVETIGPGDTLGWSWMIPPHQWRFDARSIGRTRALSIDGKRLRALCEQDHDLQSELLIRVTRLIAHRLYATRSQLIGLHN